MTSLLPRTSRQFYSTSTCHQFVGRKRYLSPSWTRHYSNEVSAADLEFGQPVHETHPHLIQSGHSMISSSHALWSVSNIHYSYT
jgi:hypothetical protein